MLLSIKTELKYAADTAMSYYDKNKDLVLKKISTCRSGLTTADDKDASDRFDAYKAKYNSIVNSRRKRAAGKDYKKKNIILM